MSLTSNLVANEAYDPKTDSWEKLEDMPTPRGGLSATAIADTIFVFGGEERFGTFTENEQYIPGEGWESRMDMSVGRHGLGAATVNDRIYVIAGGVVPGLSVSGLNESYYNAKYVPEFGTFTVLILGISLIGLLFYVNRSRIGIPKSSLN